MIIKTFTREELYEALWQIPMSKLASAWGVSVASIVRACTEMNVPRPGPGHWQLVARGWAIEREPLPAAGAGAAKELALGAVRAKMVQPASVEAPTDA